MSSDEVDKKTEEEPPKETESSAEENEEKDDAKEEKVNSKPPTKKKNAESPKIKQPAKKRVKTEQEENKKEEKKEEKKKVAKKEQDEESDDDEEGETDKVVPLLDQPLEITGSRKRKEVQRFVPKTPVEDNKEVKMPEGKGKALGDIETIGFNIQRANPEVLKYLHRICFKAIGKAATLKKNIKQFKGWEFDESSEEFEKKKAFIKTSFKKVTMSHLKSVCMILEIEKSGTKDDILDRILSFLVCPVDSGKTVPKGRSKRKGATKKNYDEGEETYDSKKKEKKRGKAKKKNVESEEESDVEEEDSEKEEENVKQNNTDKKKENSIKESEEEEEEENKVDEEEKPKKGAKKGKKAAAEVVDKKAPPKKRAAAKKAAEKAVDSEDAGEGDDESEGEDEPLVKKGKTPPTDEELVTFIKELLNGANLELITMKKVCQDVFAKYSDFDLTHKKDFIKTTVKNLISS